MSETHSAARRLGRRAGIVSAATLASRVLGYARDALVAYAFGGGHLTDAFYAAFRLPNLFRRILGEGSLTPAFVPVFSEHVSAGERPKAAEFFQTLFTTLAVLLAVLVALGILFAPAVTRLVAWGFETTDPEKFDLTVRLTRQMFPFLLFVCLAAVSAGALNTMGHFFLPSLAPAMLSVAEILFILTLSRLWKNPLEGLAWSAVAGGALHFGILLPLMKKEGILPRWRWNPGHPDVKRVSLLVLPAVWGLSVDQINAYFDTVCASFLAEGSVTALYNSNRLMQFPLALFGIAVSTAALPTLSLAAARNDHQELKDTLNFGLRLVFYLVIPAMTGLIVLGRPIIELLFEHGLFTHRETLLTYAALAGYCLGLPAYAAVKVVVGAFYALKDTRTPVRVATFCMLINMAGCLALMWRWGVGGLAVATSVASTVNASALLWLLRRRLGLPGGRRLLKTFLQSLGASLGMAAAAGAVAYGAGGSLLWKVPAAVISGAAVYAGLTSLLGMEEYRRALDILMGERTAPPAQGGGEE
ncbi:MAG: murein biosynthesis integral membrane protein MurJ [Elusimicrobiota bacterium]